MMMMIAITPRSTFFRSGSTPSELINLSKDVFQKISYSIGILDTM